MFWNCICPNKYPWLSNDYEQKFLFHGPLFYANATMYDHVNDLLDGSPHRRPIVYSNESQLLSMNRYSGRARGL